MCVQSRFFVDFTFLRLLVKSSNDKLLFCGMGMIQKMLKLSMFIFLVIGVCSKTHAQDEALVPCNFAKGLACLVGAAFTPIVQDFVKGLPALFTARSNPLNSETGALVSGGNYYLGAYNMSLYTLPSELEKLQNQIFTSSFRDELIKDSERQKECFDKRICTFVGGRDVFLSDDWKLLDARLLSEAHIILGISPDGWYTRQYSELRYVKESWDFLSKTIKNQRKKLQLNHGRDGDKMRALNAAAKTLRGEYWGRVKKLRDNGRPYTQKDPLD